MQVKELLDELTFTKVAGIDIGKAFGEAKKLTDGLTQSSKQGLGAIGKGAVIGGVSGGVTGALSDNGNDKSSGAIKGTVIGAGMGALGGSLAEKHINNVANNNYRKGLTHGAFVGAGGATAAKGGFDFIKEKTPQSAKDSLSNFFNKTKENAKNSMGDAKNLADNVKQKLDK